MNNTTSTATSKSSDDTATTNANTANGTGEADPVPKTGWALFLDMLKHESATPILVDVKEFVQRFPPNLERQDAAKRIHEFLSNTQEKMMSECIVFMADCDEQGVTNAAEGIEKLVLKQLYSQLFGIDKELEEEDKKLQRHIGCLRWIDFYHLEVPAIDPILLELGISELKRMNIYKAPRDKLVCILNACRVIGNVLRKENASRPASADDFLPLLIYSLLQANPPSLVSNVEYVATFRHPDRMMGEEAYFFTALQSAVEFIKDVGPDQLSIGKEEFDRNVKEAGEALDEDAKRPHPVEKSPQKTPMTYLSAATCEHLRMELSSLPLKYEAVPNTKNMRVREVRHLLEEYRRMARLIRFVQAEV